MQEFSQLLADQALDIGIIVWDAVLPPQYEAAFTKSKFPGITDISGYLQYLIFQVRTYDARLVIL